MLANETSDLLKPEVVGGVRLAFHGNCMFVVWTGSANEEELRALNSFAARACEISPNGVSFVVVVEAGIPIPSKAERAGIEAFFARFATQTRALAQVVEGTNLWSVMARSVFTALRLVERKPYATKLFIDTTEAIEWIDELSNSGDQESSRRLIRCLASLRDM